jgi:hypothetical protein
MLDIFDVMDCVDCDSYQYIPGRIYGDPYDCDPPEDICKDDAPDNGPCERMLGVIEDLINDGEFETASGYVATHEFIMSGEADLRGSLEGYDFSSAPAAYWFIPYSEDDKPIPFKNVEEVYWEYFDY